MTPLIRAGRRALGVQLGAGAPFRRITEIMPNAERVVVFYYAVSVLLTARMIADMHWLGRKTVEWDLLWPLAWAARLDIPLVIEVLSVMAFLTSVLAVQFHSRRAVRLAFVLTFFLAMTAVNSVGGINHPYHAWFWVGLILVALPDGRIGAMNRHNRMSYLTVILSAQAIFMLFYTMAGLYKVYFGVDAIIEGVPGNFSFSALSWTIADRSVQTGTTPLLAELIIFNPALAWPAFISVLYVQVFAVVAVFRRRLHIVWGYALIGFHLGTWLLMEIIFIQHVLLLVVLLLLSPFAAGPVSMRAVVRELPLVGLLLRPLRSAASRPLQTGGQLGDT